MPKKKDYEPQVPPDRAPPCHVKGCPSPGTYKAPLSKKSHDYGWFCLDHVREHNQKWDFMAGMTREEIEHFMKDAVTGHRPTWNRETRTSDQYTQMLHNALYEFLNPGRKAPKPQPHLSAKLRKALAVMEMEHPYTAKELKAKYRLLVKKHHPDVNKGDKKSEEMFKRVTVAYHTLVEHIKTH